MGLGEEDADAHGTGEILVARHLTTLIPGQRSTQFLGHALEQPDTARQHVLGPVTTGQVADEVQAAGPVDESHDGRLAPSPDDQVALEVTNLSPDFRSS